MSTSNAPRAVLARQLWIRAVAVFENNGLAEAQNVMGDSAGQTILNSPFLIFWQEGKLTQTTLPAKELKMEN